MLQRIALALLTSLLLYLGWPVDGITLLLFIGFVPLLLVEQQLSRKQVSRSYLKWFLYSYLAFALWNLQCCWWLVNAHWLALVAVVVINSLLMALVMLLFRFVKNKLGAQRGYISLPFLWVCMESLHKYWDLDFPWLWLGNGFATKVEWVQWYEHLGVFGGSWWIWLVNLLVFASIISFQGHRKTGPFIVQLALIALLLVALPIFLSYQRYSNYEEKGTKANITVVQHNIDTYKEKFTLTEKEQLDKFLSLARPKLGDSTDFLVGPESMLPNGVFMQRLNHDPEIQRLQNLSSANENLNIVVGSMLLQYYKGRYTSTARNLSTGGYYDAYNSALLITEGSPIQHNHKSKLVAGVEKMPFQQWLSPVLGDVSADLGGVSGSLGKSSEPYNLESADGRFKVSPLICWESDFGGYVGRYIRRGGNLIFIITNDDWWGNTAGHRQHMHYARLRAIENRRSIARSANTGISCFINQRGDVIQTLEYRTEGAISASLKANEEMTYYSQAGDLLERLSHFLAGFLLLFAFVRGFLQKSESRV